MSNQARLADGDTCGVCEACRSGRLNHCIPATMERAVGPQADGESNAAIGPLWPGRRVPDRRRGAWPRRFPFSVPDGL